MSNQTLLVEDEYLLSNTHTSFNNTNDLYKEMNKMSCLDLQKSSKDMSNFEELQSLKNICSQIEILNENTQYFKEIANKKYEEQQRLIEHYHDILKVLNKNELTIPNMIYEEEEKFKNHYNDNQNFYDTFYHKLSEIVKNLQINEEDFQYMTGIKYEQDQIKYMIKFLDYIGEELQKKKQIYQYYTKSDDNLKLDLIPLSQKDGYFVINHNFIIQLNNLVVLIDDKDISQTDKEESINQFDNKCDELKSKQESLSQKKFLNLFLKLIKSYYLQSCLNSQQ